jgi:RHS repeat-associated protein
VLDRLTAVVDAKNYRMGYGYDEVGNLVSQTDANLHITKYEYDGLNRRTAVIRPLLQRSETSYDAIGRVKETKDFNGDVIKYGYDKENQLISKQFVNEGNRIETYNTAADARSRTVTDACGTTSYAYDEQGRMLSKTEPDGKQISYTYDDATNKIASVITSSGTTQYRYNSLSQLEKVIAPEGETSYAYNAIGNLKTKTLPNGIVETYEYDGLNRVRSIVQKKDATTIASYTYSYDLVGNKTKVEELGGRVVSFDYDELYRLTKETIVDPARGGRTIEYGYDAVGNRLLKKDTAVGDIVYRYNQNDWLLDESMGNVVATAYTYDNNGNTKTRTAGAEITNYVWDTQNRLMGATISANGQVQQQLGYEYNAGGMRTKSTVNGAETRYLLDENRQYAQVLEEYSSSGIQSRYVYGAELDLLSQTRGTATSFYLEDGHSGVRQLTNTSGGVTDQYGYDGHGNVIYSIGSTQNTYQYRGEQFDPNLGMQYLRARYYNMRTGRFASVDPFEGYQELPISRHRYIYGNGNPTSFSDPSGRFSLQQLTLVQKFGLELLAIGLGAGIAYAGLGLGIASLSGGYTRWDGVYGQLNASLPLPKIGFISISGSALGAVAIAKPSRDSQVAAGWLILLAGIGVGLPLPEVSGGVAQFHADSPKLFDGIPGKSLSGPVAYGDFGAAAALPGVGSIGASWSYFTMGLGYAWSTPNETLYVGYTFGTNLLSGISIMLEPDPSPAANTPTT